MDTQTANKNTLTRPNKPVKFRIKLKLQPRPVDASPSNQPAPSCCAAFPSETPADFNKSGLWSCVGQSQPADQQVVSPDLKHCILSLGNNQLSLGDIRAAARRKRAELQGYVGPNSSPRSIGKLPPPSLPSQPRPTLSRLVSTVSVLRSGEPFGPAELLPRWDASQVKAGSAVLCLCHKFSFWHSPSSSSLPCNQPTNPSPPPPINASRRSRGGRGRRQ